MFRFTVALYSCLFICFLTVSIDGQESQPQSNRQKLLKKYDKDGDGKLNAAERQEMLKDRKRSSQRSARRQLPPADIANISYGKHKRQKLDLWLAKSDKPTPLLIYIHGGGFKAGSRRSLNKTLLTECLKSKISVAAIDYRLTQDAPLPAAMYDAARAVQFLRFHAKKYNLDPRRFAANGGSAGAGVSLWLAYHDDLADPHSKDPIARQSTRLTCALVQGAQTSYDPRFINKLFGIDIYTDPTRLSELYGLKENELKTEKAYKIYQEVAPITHLSPDDPPVFMFYYQSNHPITPNAHRREWVHHPRFAEPLKKKAGSLKREVVVKLLEDYPKNNRHAVFADMVTFLKRHFR
ncbi:MAG: alpha/beta hydrolase fold domain-containing protein [Planctomycetota bacterium]